MTGLIFDQIMKMHQYRSTYHGDTHPEQPDRITEIYNKLKTNNLTDLCTHIPIRPASDAELLTTHTLEYLNEIKKSHNAPDKTLNLLEKKYNSIYLNKNSFSSALYSCGGVIELCEHVIQGNLNNGVAIVRPPGHHAEHNCAMGFCLFNNVAVAANVLKRKYNVKKIVIIDWDVHHGNATQHSFYNDPSVLYLSLHRYDNGNFYPSSKDAHSSYIGTNAGSGYNINIAFNTNKNSIIDDNDYKLAFETIVEPVLKEFAPEIIIVSAGFDCSEGDPLGGFHLSPDIFYYMTRSLMSISRTVIALEGGYNLESISNSMNACVEALVGKIHINTFVSNPKKINKYDPACISAISETNYAIKGYWKCLKN